MKQASGTGRGWNEMFAEKTILSSKSPADLHVQPLKTETSMCAHVHTTPLK
jgi:hypothetical protein